MLADTRESRYVDDAYCEMLRGDLCAWKEAGAALSEVERARYEAAVLNENWLLDQRELEQ